jgi:hypothetical protein
LAAENSCARVFKARKHSSSPLSSSSSPKIAYIPAEYLIGAVGAAVGTVVEAASFGPDDNLAIPLSVGVVMWALYSLILPAIDVFSLDRLM